MRVQIDPSVLGKTKWHEYAVRFVFGGLITAVAGLIAKHYGPVVGGLFLACPAIFPASATLIEKHEAEKKELLGLDGKVRGREAASVDATGSAMGSLGLVIFAVINWKFLPSYQTWLILPIATVAWMLVSALLWHFRKRDQAMVPRQSKQPQIGR